MEGGGDIGKKWSGGGLDPIKCMPCELACAQARWRAGMRVRRVGWHVGLVTSASGTRMAGPMEGPNGGTDDVSKAGPIRTNCGTQPYANLFCFNCGRAFALLTKNCDGFFDDTILQATPSRMNRSDTTSIAG